MDQEIFCSRQEGPQAHNNKGGVFNLAWLMLLIVINLGNLRMLRFDRFIHAQTDHYDLFTTEVGTITQLVLLTRIRDWMPIICLYIPS
jgi:hypothetical protein